MFHSTVTSEGQTTIPGEIRETLRNQSGDKVEYVPEGDYATIRVHSGTAALRGALARAKGKGMSFAEVRAAAAKAAREPEGFRRGRAGLSIR